MKQDTTRMTHLNYTVHPHTYVFYTDSNKLPFALLSFVICQHSWSLKKWSVSLLLLEAYCPEQSPNSVVCYQGNNHKQIWPQSINSSLSPHTIVFSIWYVFQTFTSTVFMRFLGGINSISRLRERNHQEGTQVTELGLGCSLAPNQCSQHLRLNKSNALSYSASYCL